MKTLSNIFDAQELNAMLTPFDEASAPPARYHTSADLHGQEAPAGKGLEAIATEPA
jgi:hypothetical protein